MSGKLNARPLYSWLHILHKSTDVTCDKLSFRLKLQLWSARLVGWALQTPACLCCILICTLLEVFDGFKLDLRFTGDPICDKWQHLSWTYRTKKSVVMILVSCCSSPCLISLSPQPSVYLSPYSSFPQSHIFQVSESCFIYLSWLPSWLQIGFCTGTTAISVKKCEVKGKLFLMFCSF